MCYVKGVFRLILVVGSLFSEDFNNFKLGWIKIIFVIFCDF